MNCAYHAQNSAVVNCNGCNRPLCAGCDHRIKGFPYCEDCIVEGVNILRTSDRSRYSAKIRKRTYPVVALFLSWVCPGLGAAYNGQMVKALAHFGIVAGLFQMAVSTKMALFILALIAMWWFFLPLDAWRSAKLIRSGMDQDGSDDLVLERLTGNAKISGVILVAIGGLFFVNTFLGGRFIVKGVLPLLLIFLGLYLLKPYAFGGRVRPETVSDPYLARYGDPGDRFKDGPPKSSWRN